MKRKLAIPWIMLGMLLTACACWHWLTSAEGDPSTVLVASAASGSTRARSATTLETRHYIIRSTATPSQTAQVAAAVESLHDAYTAFFPGLPTGSADEKLKMVLYRDKREFKANNRSRPWAEAYYQPPACYAYYADGHPNPYHWMVHEATHQLNREVAGFKKTQWIDEGLASYFGASRIEHGRLLPGTIDTNTYPIWWLTSLALSGDLDDDIAKRRIIPLRELVSGTGPDIGHHVNLYYIQFWSLSHFLFHYNGGQYAGRYRKLIAEGGSLEDFEATIGPIDQVQGQWYAYLRERISSIPPAAALQATGR